MQYDFHTIKTMNNLVGKILLHHSKQIKVYVPEKQMWEHMYYLQDVLAAMHIPYETDVANNRFIFPQFQNKEVIFGYGNPKVSELININVIYFIDRSFA